MSSKIELYNNIFLSLDTGGNIYLNYNNIDYDIEIDKNNSLHLNEYLFDNQKDDNNLLEKLYYEKKLKIKEYYQSNLKKKILKKENELDDEDMFDIDDDYKNNFYENNYFHYESNSDSESEYNSNQENEKLILIKDNLDIKLLNREDISLYDLILYDESNNIILATSFKNYIPMYRINLYKNGFLTFRPISETLKTYIIKVIDNKLVLECKDFV